MTITYSPAVELGWVCIARGRLSVLVQPSVASSADTDADADLVPRLWAAMGEVSPLEPVLDRLTRHGLSATPSFAVLEASAVTGLRVIVRGGVRATVTDAAGEHLLVGTGVSTWAERTFSGAESARVVVPGSTAAPFTLTLESGAVYAAELTLDVAESRTEEGLDAGLDAGAAAKDGGSAALEPVAPDPASPESPESEPAAREPANSALEQTVVVPARTRVGRAAAAGSAPAAEQTVASPPEKASPPPGGPSAPPAGDHDGETVMSKDLKALRASAAAGPASAGALGSESEGDAAGHGSAASALRLALVGGDAQPLDRTVLIGRSPSVAQVSGGSMPHLMMVGVGDHDISRNHVQVALEGDTVVVTDLHSRNGTVVVLPDKPPQKLRAGEPTAVIVGTVIDLGGGVTIVVERA